MLRTIQGRGSLSICVSLLFSLTPGPRGVGSACSIYNRYGGFVGWRSSVFTSEIMLPFQSHSVCWVGVTDSFIFE